MLEIKQHEHITWDLGVSSFEGSTTLILVLQGDEPLVLAVRSTDAPRNAKCPITLTTRTSGQSSDLLQASK